MAYEFKLPDLGEGLTEGEIARWLVAEGQEVAEDDPLVEIQTDKTTVEIPSPAAGTVTRILVAEDNPTNRQILAAYLAMAGHSSHLVNDGAEACAAMEGEEFDLVIMDVQMPVMDGVTATRRIRDLDGEKAAVPIIALTANAMQGDRDRFLAAGMNDYVSKPVMLPELYGAIARCLDGYFASSDGATGWDSRSVSVS